MDPNAALDTILDNIMYFFTQESPDENTHYETPQEEHARLMEICEKFNNLHHWLLDGGFLPTRWEQNRQRRGIFLKGNLSDGFKAMGPYPSIDEALNNNDDGWGMELVND